MAVLTGSGGEVDAPALHFEVMIGRRHNHLADVQRLVEIGESARERTRAIENSGEGARAAGRKVQDDANGGRQVFGQARHKALERVHAAGRCADHDEVSGLAALCELV